MKAIVSLAILLICSFGLNAQAVTEYFSVGDPITFCGTEYYLAWSSHPQENYYLQEYLPKGESFENYKQMFTVSVIFWDTTPKEATQAKIDELEKRKQTDPVTNYVVFEKHGDYMLEFVVSDTDIDSNTHNLVELDVHHYKQMTFNGRKASVLEFYSCRAYGDDILPFIQSIPENRLTWYEGMRQLNLKPEFPKK